jgi:hypothetical protein
MVCFGCVVGVSLKAKEKIMATDTTRMMVQIAAIITTVYEYDKEFHSPFIPKSGVYLAFQQEGYDIHHFNLLMEIGDKLGLWKITPETISLTELGVEKAKKLAEIERPLNS